MATASTAPEPTAPQPTPPPRWLVASRAELARLPTTGRAWRRLKAAADGSLGPAKLADFESDHDVRTLAVALVYARTGQARYRVKAADAIMAVIGTEDGGLAVQLGRNLVSYVLAANLIGFREYDPRREATFSEWLKTVPYEQFRDGSLVREDFKKANNHGRVAGLSRLAAAIYLQDSRNIDAGVAIYKGWLGDESAYNGFTWRADLSWQADPRRPVGINPKGTTSASRAVDGALPEEMRRGCSRRFPPCRTEYPWGGLQAGLLVAKILENQGYDAWEWEDRALLRAVRFLHRLERRYGGWWARSDHAWQPWLVNAAYGTNFPTPQLGKLGKVFAWADWLYGPTTRSR